LSKNTPDRIERVKEGFPSVSAAAECHGPALKAL